MHMCQIKACFVSRERHNETQRAEIQNRQKELEITRCRRGKRGEQEKGSLSGFMTMVGKGEQWWVEEET